MDKKDVLGASAAAGNVQKMKSAPHGFSAGNAQNTTLIPSILLGIILADLIHSILLLGYSIKRIIPSNLLLIVRYQNDIECCTGNIL